MPRIVGGKSMLFLRILIVAFIVTGIMDLLAKKVGKNRSIEKICRTSSTRFCRIGNYSNDNRNINPLLWGEYKVYNVRICV